MTDGWLKVWRKLRDNPYLRDAVQLSIFVTLLLDAELRDSQHRHRNGVIILRRGQTIMSERALADRLNIGREPTRRALRNLKKGGLINPLSNPHCTIVTICNFDKYQGPIDCDQPTGQPTGQPTPNPRPTHLFLREEEGEKKEEEKYNSPSAPNGQGSHQPRWSLKQTDEALGIWHNELGDVLSRVIKLTPARRKVMCGRLTDLGSLEAWQLYCRKIRNTPFLVGENPRGWRADFDWTVKQAHMARILEGRYDRQLV